MEPWRTILVIATVVGFVLTAGGLIAAFVGARREHREAAERIDRMRALSEQEHAETEALGDSRTPEQSEAVHDASEARYRAADLVRPSYDNMVYLAAYESRRLLGMVLDESRRDFLIAGLGLLVSTAASIGSLYLTGDA